MAVLRIFQIRADKRTQRDSVMFAKEVSKARGIDFDEFPDEIREKYSGMSKSEIRQVAMSPTTAFRGSPERVFIYQIRLTHGLSLWNPLDSRETCPEERRPSGPDHGGRRFYDAREEDLS